MGDLLYVRYYLSILSVHGALAKVAHQLVHLLGIFVLFKGLILRF